MNIYSQSSNFKFAAIDIPQQEIIEDIFSRLPAKSIARFRCVSKPWNSLLSEPQFIKTHLNRIKQLPGVKQSLMLVSDDTQSLYSVHFHNAHQVFDEMTTHANAIKLDFGDHKFGSETVYQHMASCDGLVLVKDEDDNLILINPMTREIKEVPESPYALNPHHSFIMYGLRYNALAHDYKVVTLSYHNEYYYCDLESDEDDSDDTKMYVNVYSVKNGTWKRAKSSPYDHAVGHVTSGVFVNGCIHWLASETSGYSSVIVAFDLEEEDYYEVPPPPPCSVDHEKFVFYGLVELGGCLCMYSATGVWMMKEYGVEQSWTKLVLECKEYRPLCLLGKEQLLWVEDEEIVEKFVMYNLKQGTCKDVVVEDIPPDFGFGGAFLESLVSPNCINEVTTER